MHIARSLEKLPSSRLGTLALVPTMGALHSGHLSLVEQAKTHADRVAVSIFVNPMQFGPSEDFSRYPRTEDADLALLEKAGVDLVWLPPVKVMYPEGYATSIHVSELGDGLCGAFRPGHFDGVATVVAKLFLQVKPDKAVFGEKDYQQLQIIRRMVTDLNMGIEILGGPIVRESDGLALSSRNRYLSETERRIAPQLYHILRDTAARLQAGHRNALQESKDALLAEGFTKLDYLELVDSETLKPLMQLDGSARLLAAVWIGSTRLIDNIAV